MSVAKDNCSNSQIHKFTRIHQPFSLPKSLPKNPISWNSPTHQSAKKTRLQGSAAPAILITISLRTNLYIARSVQQPRFGLIRLTCKSRGTFMIVQIQLVTICCRHVVYSNRFIHIPVNEIGGIGKVVPDTPVLSRCILVLGPRTIQRLSEPIGRAGTTPRYKSEQFFARWLGLGSKRTLLIHKCHRQVHGCAPLLLRRFSRFVPTSFFGKDCAHIVRPRRLRSTCLQRHNKGEQQYPTGGVVCESITQKGPGSIHASSVDSQTV